VKLIESSKIWGAILCVFVAAFGLVGCQTKSELNRSNAEDGVSLLFRKGSEWTYAGQLEWTVGTQIFATNIQWTMSVVDVAKTTNAEVAIVRGFVSELAWYEPGMPVGFTVIAKVENWIYRFPCENEAAAQTQARKLIEEGVSADEEPWLDLPLAREKRWALNPERTDTFYCWRVEDEAMRRIAARGTNAREARTWQVVYRTNPDHQIFTVAEGVGIIAYEFAHHGTVASAKVELKAIKVPSD
jgi:hypothetical protein